VSDSGAGLRPRHLRILLLARIVSRVDVVNASRADELNLEDRPLVFCPNIMSVLCRQRLQGTRLDHLAFRSVELFAHAKANISAT
jgi:hypothetical protein